MVNISSFSSYDGLSILTGCSVFSAVCTEKFSVMSMCRDSENLGELRFSFVLIMALMSLRMVLPFFFFRLTADLPRLDFEPPKLNAPRPCKVDGLMLVSDHTRSLAYSPCNLSLSDSKSRPIESIISVIWTSSMKAI